MQMREESLTTVATEMSTATSVEDLTDCQYEFLKQFKKNISDVLPPDLSDAWLIKWLRSHNYNLTKTEALFRGTMRMRVVYDVDNVVQNYVEPEVVSKYGFTTSLGIAKNGSPIRYTRIGVGDLHGFLMSLTAYDICLYCSYIVEYDMALIKKENQKNGKQVNEVTYIMDMEHFSIQTIMNKAAIETGLDLLQLMQDYYPEIWGNIFVVNAPSYFDKVFNIFKPLLRLNMLRKIRVASSESTPVLLLKYIDEDVLPVFLGGKKIDSRTEFVVSGGTVPEEYYIRNRFSPMLRSSDEGVTSVWVSARSVYNHSVLVRKPGSRIEINIRAENGSVGLKMFYRDLGSDPSCPDFPSCDEYLDENDPESNVHHCSPYIRTQTHIAPVVGQIVRAPWLGIYIFKFDNTHSWFRSKRITFRIQVVQES